MYTIDSSGIEKSIFTVGLNGFGYALDIENSVGITSSTLSKTDATLPKNPAERTEQLDSDSPTNVWPTVPTIIELSPLVLIAEVEKVVCLSITSWAKEADIKKQSKIFNLFIENSFRYS